MAATVTETTAGLKDRLSAIPGLRTFDHVPDSIPVPMATVGVEDITFHRSFSGGDPVYTFTISVIVARADERSAQRALDGYVSWDGQTSVRAAIEADKTLNGTVQTLIVESASNIRVIQANEATYLAVDFTVVVHA
jgi:hypothetical protein